MTFEELIICKGYNRDQLSYKIGTGTASICSWCEGKTMPRPVRLAKLKIVLGVSEEQIKESIRESAKNPPDKKLTCICGCGEKFERKGSGHVYYSRTCRENFNKKNNPEGDEPKKYDTSLNPFNMIERHKKRGGKKSKLKNEYTSDFLKQKIEEFLSNGGKIKYEKPFDVCYEETMLGRELMDFEETFGGI